MHIAILGTRGIPLGYSGYETLAAELARRLVERGHRVTVYAYRHMFRSRPAFHQGTRIRYQRGMRGKRTAQFSHSLRASLDVVFRRPDVVLFCNAANGAFGILLRLARIRCVINVDGLEWRRPKWGGLARAWFRCGAWCATRFFHRVVTDARAMQEIYRREFRCASVCIAYGANLVASRDPSCLARYGVASREYYLVVGRMVPDNNADLIVRAYRESGSRKKLLVVGGTTYRDEFQERLRKQAGEGVAFSGTIDDQDVLNELYCNAFAYVHGHEYGGTNPALLRALGAGCCVLALDTEFNREVLAGGRYGRLFRKDEGDLARSLRDMEADPAAVDELRRRAPERIRQEYTWEKITEQYLEVFSALCRS